MRLLPECFTLSYHVRPGVLVQVGNKQFVLNHSRRFVRRIRLCAHHQILFRGSQAVFSSSVSNSSLSSVLLFFVFSSFFKVDHSSLHTGDLWFSAADPEQHALWIGSVDDSYTKIITRSFIYSVKRAADPPTATHISLSLRTNFIDYIVSLASNLPHHSSRSVAS